MSNLHVLILPSGYPTRYAPLSAVFYQEQARALYKAGVQVGVIYPELRSLRTFSLKGVLENRFQMALSNEDNIPTLRLHGWNVPSARFRSKLFAHMAVRLARDYMKRFGRPDIIHAHSVFWAGVAAREVGRELDIPYIITEHSSLFMRGLIKTWQEPLIQATLQDAAGVLAVSRALAYQLAPYVKNKEIDVVPNVVDTDYFILPAKPRVLKPFRFLTIAFLISCKGIDILLHAFARAFSNDKNVILEIGGDGPQRDKLENLANRLGIRDQVKFLGVLSREAVRQALWRANTFVLPSYAETFGVVLIEAMATGLPVIATRCGGPEDIVTPEVGFLVDPGDVKALAQVLKTIRSDYNRFMMKTHEIRKVAVTRFSYEAVVNQMLFHYKKIRLC